MPLGRLMELSLERCDFRRVCGFSLCQSAARSSSIVLGSGTRCLLRGQVLLCRSPTQHTARECGEGCNTSAANQYRTFNAAAVDASADARVALAVAAAACSAARSSSHAA